MDVCTRSASILWAFAVGALAQNPPPPPGFSPEEYRVRDAVEGSFVNLGTFPVRPMAFDATGNLWALNHHNSTILRYTGLASPATEFALPWGPTAVAFWSGANPSDPDDDRMLVACMGSWAVVELSVATGDVLALHQLRPQGLDSSRQGDGATPGDIIVVGNQAIVSCPASDTLLQIDLSANPRTIFVYGRDTTPAFPELLAKSPLFLSKGPGGKVYVAPLVSGNNTISQQSVAFATKVIQPSDPMQGLPDRDLFEIDPVAHTLKSVAKSMGTLLFAHGVNPASDPPQMWMLNTEAFNVVDHLGGAMNSEPVVNGRFSFDRITTFTLPTPPALAFQGTPTWLNPNAPIGGIAGMTAPIGQPFSLTFLDDAADAAHGHAFLCGLLTDNVLVLDKNRAFVKQFNLPDGSIPRQVLLNPGNDRLVVYCWGTNTVRIFDWAAAGAPLTGFLRLGHDPTPASLRAGRTLFYDAQHSRFGNLSCASCHVEGGADLLAWNLSNAPQDDKGPMITQTLVGIQRMGPFHWRGERALADFHGAFKGLLGKVDPITSLPADLDPAAFAQLEAYIFSLVNPANPNQSRRRVLDDALPTPRAPGASAISGQTTFNDTVVFQGNATCADCHTMPLGTGNDIIDEAPGHNFPRRAQLKPTPFHELFRKQGPVATHAFGANGPPSTAGNIVDAALLGAGMAHTGVFGDLFAFIAGITVPDVHDGPITAFVHQWDQGLGQAAHYAFLLDQFADPVAASAELDTFLLDQARGRAGDIPSMAAPSRRNCDIVVFGTVRNASGTAFRRRWFFDREANAGAGAFRCDDPTFTTTGSPAGQRTLADFLGRAGLESNVFLGLPVGLGERFGVDFDLDGTYNAADPSRLDPAIPGAAAGPVAFVTTNPAEPAQVLWKTSKVARIRFDTNLPTRFDAFVWPVGGTMPSTPTSSSDAFGRNHAFLVTDLRPSTNHDGPGTPPIYGLKAITYNVRIVATARNGNSAQTDLLIAPQGHKESTNFSLDNPAQERLLTNHVVSSLTMTPIAGSGSLPARRVTITTSYKRGGSFVGNVFRRPRAEDRVILARVFAHDTQTLHTRPLDHNQVAPLPPPPPSQPTMFLVDNVFLNSATNTNTKLTVGLDPVTGARGTLLVSNMPTATSGATTMEFELLQPLGANEKLVFSIEAVVHVDPDFNVWTGATMATGTPPNVQLILPTMTRFDPTTGVQNTAWSKWSFPDTKEAGAEVRDP